MTEQDEYEKYERAYWAGFTDGYERAIEVINAKYTTPAPPGDDLASEPTGPIPRVQPE